MADTNIGLWGSISSFFIVVLGLLGFRGQINNLHRTKVDVTAFREYKTSIDKQFTNQQEDLTEIKSDIKEILKHAAQRRNGD